MAEVRAQMTGTVVSVAVGPGDSVAPDTPVVVIESMKMEFDVRAETSGTVSAVLVAAGDDVAEGQILVEVD